MWSLLCKDIVGIDEGNYEYGRGSKPPHFFRFFLLIFEFPFKTENLSSKSITSGPPSKRHFHYLHFVGILDSGKVTFVS